MPERWVGDGLRGFPVQPFGWYVRCGEVEDGKWKGSGGLIYRGSFS